MWQVLRNIYCLYGSTAVLWWLQPQILQDGLWTQNNTSLVVWFVSIAGHFGVIYDLEGVSTTEVATRFVIMLLVTEGFLAVCLGRHLWA
jgi:hypothetical protein